MEIWGIVNFEIPPSPIFQEFEIVPLSKFTQCPQFPNVAVHHFPPSYFPTFPMSQFPLSHFPPSHFQFPNCQISWIFYSQFHSAINFRISKFPKLQNSEFPNFQFSTCPNAPMSQCPNVPIPKFKHFQIYKFLNFPIPLMHSFQIPKFLKLYDKFGTSK